MKNKRLETMLSDLSLYSQPARKASDWAEVMASLRDVKPRSIVKMFGKYPTPENISDHAALIREWNSVYRKASASQKAALIRDNAAFHASRSVNSNPRKKKRPATQAEARAFFDAYYAQIAREAEAVDPGAARRRNEATLARMRAERLAKNPRSDLKKRPATAMFLELRDGATGKRIGPLFDLKHTSMATIKAAAQGYHARTGHAISAHRVKK